MTEYTHTSVGDNMYEIETIFNGEPITFNVVVAQDESEIEELVEHHLQYLSNPAPVYTETQPVQPTVAELQAQLNALQEQLRQLTGN